MRPLAVVTATAYNSRHWTPGEVTWEKIQLWMASPFGVKKCGTYLLGTLIQTTVEHSGKPCTDYHRRKHSVVYRSVLTLDVDYPEEGFVGRVRALLPYRHLIHTTFSSTPDAPRYRLLIPLARDVSPAEYTALAQEVMETLGIDQFDKGSAEPERYMFLPAAPDPDLFQWWVVEGPEMEVKAEIRDTLPASPRNQKRDPTGLSGVVGAFNRAYGDMDDVMTAYDLPYTAAREADRWHLAGAHSEAGLVLVAPGLVYSHHSNDPAVGETCSAFDLVRLHRFADLDLLSPPGTPVNRLPSHKAMTDLAATDPRVIADLVGTDFSEEGKDSWQLDLRISPKTGKLLDVIDNWDLIIANDPSFSSLRYNEMSMNVEVSRDLPWRPLSDGETFDRTDRMALCHHLERVYRVRPGRLLVDELVDTRSRRNRYHPVQDYLSGLRWDGTPRLETCLPGVLPTPYTRTVARKSLTAAVARIFEPGVKWDHTLVILGREGIGKTYWIDRMARGHSASLGRIGDKDTLLIMQRSWIMVSDEGHHLRPGDSDAHKEFLTRASDVIRMPYERESVSYPRRCVIWGTTNDPVFLRRQEGNRRFLIVSAEQRVDFTALTDAYIDQVWAEAVAIYRSGEPLYLSDDSIALALEEREPHTEEDALVGIVQAYLELLVPPEWGEMTPDSRRAWVQNRADGIVPEGTTQINRVCSVQLWVEALGRRMGDHRRGDLLDIIRALRSVPGWQPTASRHRLPHYGPQLTFIRSPE